MLIALKQALWKMTKVYFHSLSIKTLKKVLNTKILSFKIKNIQIANKNLQTLPKPDRVYTVCRLCTATQQLTEVFLIWNLLQNLHRQLVEICSFIYSKSKIRPRQDHKVRRGDVRPKISTVHKMITRLIFNSVSASL